MNETLIREVVNEVLRNLNTSSQFQINSGQSQAGNFGVFETADLAAQAAHDSFLQLQEKGVEARRKVIEIVKGMCEANAEDWGKQELQESKIGRLDHKIEKLQIIKHVPGV